MRRRAVGLRGFLYFVRTHTRPTVPRDRSAAALRGDGTVAQTLVLSDRTRKGKGLRSADFFLTPQEPLL